MTSDLLQLVGQRFTYTGKYSPDIVSTRLLYFLAAFNDHVKVSSMFLDLVIHNSLTTLFLKLYVFFNIEQISHYSFNFYSPFKWIKLSLEYLVFLRFLKQELLFFLAMRIKETNFSLFYSAMSNFTS